jgi:hypothetical protein
MSQSIAIDVSDQNTADLIYKKIDDIYLNKKKTKSEILSYLISLGISKETAVEMYNNSMSELSSADKDAAESDMIYGFFWFIGGTTLTLAEVGYVFYGAIIFGGIKFLKGAYNYITN